MKRSSIKSDNAQERLPLVDEAGNVIGCATRKECHSGSKLLHPVVHLHLLDTAGRLYLQKRPDWKDIQPGKWDTAVGGHIDYGEELTHALRREVREEIGIVDFTPLEVAKYVFESQIEKELINVFITVTDAQPIPSDELDGGRFWSIEEILLNLDRDIFTPNFTNEFRSILLPYLSTNPIDVWSNYELR